MTEERLNARQQEAVTRIDGDLLVRAGAGTGKTRVLTRRFHHLAHGENVGVDSILAITFTEKAAAEMKERVARRFDREDRPDVEFAPISTIHAFCARLLHEEAIRAGVDPHFTVIEPLEAEDLLQAAFDGTYRAWRTRRSGDLGAVLSLGTDDIREEILDFHHRVRSTPRSLETLTLSTAGGDPDGLLGQVRSLLSEDLPEAILSLLGQLDRSDLEVVDVVAALEKAINLNQLRGHPRVKLLGDVKRTVLPALAGALLDREAGRIFPALRDFLVDLESAYREGKRARSGLDFSDLEREALRLLRILKEEGESLQVTFRHILVDEYQDTNPIQEEIIRSVQGMCRGAHRFAVGDPVQSIYRFRGAEVEVMGDYARRVGADRVITLEETYRPAPDLLRFQNAFFEEAAVLKQGDEFDRREDPSVEILLSPVDEGGDVREAEANRIAGHIAGILRTSSIRFTRKRHDRRGEPVRAGDIVILFRASTHIPVYERALRDFGLRSYVVKGRGFFGVQEILDLENLIRVVVRPRDEMALAAYLTSPYVDLADEDLFRFFLWRRSAPPGVPWGAAADVETLPDSLRDGIRRAAEAVDTLRSVEASGGIFDLVERAIRMGRYDLVALMQEGGVRRLANLRKIEEIARRLDRDGGYGAPDLLRMMEDLRERDADEREAPLGAEGEDLVRLMTVHAAKGLEFPVVIVADLGWKPRTAGPVIDMDPEGGISFRVRGILPGKNHVPGGYRGIQERQKAAAAEEERRLLYVAMTRAQEHLILSSWIKKQRWGWLKILADTCDLPAEEGTTDALLEDAPYRVHLGGADPPPRVTQRRRGDPSPVPEESLEKARKLWGDASRPADPGDMVPFVVSTSDLIRFSTCPLAYFWSNLVGSWGGRRPRAEEETPVPRPGEDEIEDREDRRRMGTLVHSLLETGSFREGPGEDVIRPAFLEEFQRDPRPEEVAEAGRLVESFLRSDWGRITAELEEADPAAVIREQPFHLRHEGLLIKGTLDLLLRPPGDRPVVIDYKTGSPGGGEPGDDPYALQMRIYSLAVESILREPCRAILFYLAGKAGREIPPDGSDVTRVVRALREAHEGTPPGGGPAPHFAAHPSGDRCRVCDFRATCPEARSS